MSNATEAAVPLREIQQSVGVLDCETPPLRKHMKIEEAQNNSAASDHKTGSCKCKPSAGLGTPDRLKVPKPFKYPERYTSPTDNIISPISKGILARSRKGSALLPPSKIQSKIRELRSPDVGRIQLKMEQ